jgi:hypothetical protein
VPLGVLDDFFILYHRRVSKSVSKDSREIRRRNINWQFLLTVVNDFVGSSLSHCLSHLCYLPDMIQLVIKRIGLISPSVTTSSGLVGGVELCDPVSVTIEDRITKLAVILCLTRDDLKKALRSV